ncbi:single-stranded nucleic acid binding R3H domain-containing protein [Thermodesulfatator indicus DSM 15286]|uniref:RNA-binding protein KhpB n=1 Tax=Thermodesulfatator indicus (strain DSM 15286 / JCM 11887 / CIR29812) TaxID=667014 RepID=F8ABR0_THEID|nr:RNA-binding cell elongation regulator Jag/EloR [Thermodesulfatator indicus]AEH44512.1 single-stranded nucleic acid binding R3H domain-containing protein [Thermodesulfatator indicus DSM 15286]
MISEEFEAKTLDQAVELACKHFGVERDDLDIEVLSQGSTGIFGIGAKKARIKASIKPETLLKKRAEEAQRVLVKLITSGDLEINFSFEIKPNGISFSLSGPDSKLFVAKDGAPLNALQYLINKIVAKRLGVGPKITLNIEGFKNGKSQKLEGLARKAAKEAIKTKKPVFLPPMPASDRRQIHLAVKKMKGVISRSRGVGQKRRVVIFPQSSRFSGRRPK